jgi:hypothetical protein
MATASKKEWTPEEFAREVRPVEQHFRVYHIEGRGPAGHAVMIATARDAEGRDYMLGDPVWKECAGLSVSSELATIPIDHSQQLLDSLWSMGLRPTEDPAILAEQRLDRLEAAVVYIATRVTECDHEAVLARVTEILAEG